MPIPTSHLKERLSVTYVRAVIAKAGASYFTIDGTEYGTDAIIQKVIVLQNGKYSNTGWQFNCQIKSTTDWIEKADKIIYDMDVDAYNKLVCWEGTPCILILFRLPQDYQEWLNLDEDCLHIKNCCYWRHIIGTPSENLEKIRIEIPRNQLFTPELVEDLLERLKVNQGTLD